MRTIKLKSLSLRNFKGQRTADFDFDCKDVTVIGANGTGKTTIYDAYLWCLFGKTSGANAQVQTLDESNRVVHKIETSVSMVLVIDGSFEVMLERKLIEKWRAQGTPEERMTGTEIQRYYNGIPLSMREYNVKLNALFDFGKWELLSSVNGFMQMKAEERRRLLLSMSEEVNDTILSEPFPEVRKALTEDRKSIDEFARQTKSTKEQADKELQGIPQAISAQDMLKSNADFISLRNKELALNAEIDEIDASLQADSDEISARSHQKQKIVEAERELQNYILDWNAKHREEVLSREDAVTQAIAKAKKIKNDIATAEFSLQSVDIPKRTALATMYEEKKAEWNSENNSVYKYVVKAECPYCHKPYTEEEKTSMRLQQVKQYNLQKSEMLRKLEQEAYELSQRLAQVKALVNETTEITLPRLRSELFSAEKEQKEAERKLEEVKLGKYTEDEVYKSLSSKVDELRNALVISNKEESVEQLKQRKTELRKQRDDVVSQLAAENTNKLIEEHKEALNKRAKELSQIIADCDNKLYQIQKFKEAKINAVEDGVNNHFSIVKWKFFEQNISNENKREICVCLIGGVDYDNDNTANKVNAGIDIVNGLAKVNDVSVPLFIDGKESVTHLIDSEAQIIALKVKDNEKLNLMYNN